MLIGSGNQSSYLSLISQIIFVEKNLSCGEFQISVKNLNNLWSFIKIYVVFVLNLCGEKSVWKNLCGEKMTNMRSELNIGRICMFSTEKSPSQVANCQQLLSERAHGRCP